MLFKPLVNFIVKNVKFHYNQSQTNPNFMLEMSQSFLNSLIYDFDDGLLKVGEVVPQDVLLFPDGYHSKHIAFSEEIKSIEEKFKNKFKEEKDLELTQEVFDILKTLSDKDENSSKNYEDVLALLEMFWI